MSKIIVELVCSAIIIVSIWYYFKAISSFKNSERGQRVLANGSQVTFSAFIIGFAFIMILINTISVSRGRFIHFVLYHATFVCAVNALGIKYYNKNLEKTSE